MTNKNKFARVALFVLGGTVVLAPLQLYFAGNWYSFFHSYSLGMAFGIVAYGCFLTALVLACRLRFLDRVFGHDRVLVFHGYLAVTGLVLAFTHVVFKLLFAAYIDLQVLMGIAALFLFFSIAGVTILLMADTVLTRQGPPQRLRQWLLGLLRADYSQLKFIHNATVIASVLVAVHVLLASATQELTARSLVMGGWAACALALYLYHKLIRLAVMKSKGCRVQSVKIPSDGIVEIALRSGRPLFARHRAGQFGYFRFLSPVCGREEHPFTIASAPHAKECTIVVKNLGNYTARLPGVAPGTAVLADGPYGRFTPNLQSGVHLLVAGGIGITPFLSLLRQLADTGTACPVTLVWSVRQESELVYRDFFEGLHNQGVMRFVPVVTRQEGFSPGRVDRLLLERVLDGVNCAELQVWYCGPQSLRESLFVEMRRKGVPARAFHYELFSF